MEYRGTDAQALLLLIDHELAISELYTAYANIFPNHRQFWQKLAGEETDHADTIKGLLEIAGDESLDFNSKGFKQAAVNTSLTYLRETASRVRQSPVAIRDALSTALDLEKAMIERKFFDIFDTPAPRVQDALLVLTEGTQEHVRTIESEWQRFRSA